jgi:solute carrier family 10 (sodium/bile acid cotransporter), member 7
LCFILPYKRHFLPCGLLLSVVAALVFPEPGAIIKTWNVIPEAVRLIFLVNGFQSCFKWGEVNGAFLKAFGVMLVLSLCLSPFIGVCWVRWLNIAPEIAVGLMVMSAMPTTLSSGMVISGVAGGSPLWALMFTIGMNFLGIFSIPFFLSLTLGHVEIHLSPLSLLLDLLKMVFGPYMLGLVLKKVISHGKTSFPDKSWLQIFKNVLDILPTLCVIFVVWVSLSASVEGLLNIDVKTLWWCFIAAMGVHGVLLGLHFGSGKWLGLTEPELKSFVIVGSQKTLPIALSVLAALNLTQVGPAIMICLIFHFSQLLLDSFMASQWASITSHRH